MHRNFFRIASICALVISSGCERPMTSVEHLERGILLAQRDRFDEAIQEFDRSLELVPEVSAVFYERAIVKARLGQLDAAMEDYSTSIQLEPEFVQAYFNRAELLERQEKFADAIAEYTAVLRIEPTFLEAIERRGMLHKQVGDFDSAFADFVRVLELEPNANCFMQCGWIHLDRQRFHQADADFASAIELDPSAARAWHGRALASVKMGARETALEYLAQAAKLDAGVASLDVIAMLNELADKPLDKLQLASDQAQSSDRLDSAISDQKIIDFFSTLGWSVQKLEHAVFRFRIRPNGSEPSRLLYAAQGLGGKASLNLSSDHFRALAQSKEPLSLLYQVRREDGTFQLEFIDQWSPKVDQIETLIVKLDSGRK